MKQVLSVKLSVLAFSAIFPAALGASASAASSSQPTFYKLTITNGSAMPISPLAVYVKNGQANLTQVGKTPSTGFIQLCQTGNPALRAQEIGADSSVTFKTTTNGLIMPGESKSLEVEVQDPLNQGIHFEGMYGKTKDACAVARIGSQQLNSLKTGRVAQVIGKDEVLATGAFRDPVLPQGRTAQDISLCDGQMDAVSCLRVLAAPNTGKQTVRFFSSYLASVQTLLDNKFGAEDVQSLIIPSSGAVEYRLTLKH